MEMTAAELAAHVRKEFAKVIVGQNDALDQLLLVLLARGHALIEGVPGLAKTLAVKALAHICRLDFQRIQCTPDLIPGDILGGNMFDQCTGQFRIHRGPIFADMLLVDEINRMPPRTQSALLEAMEEARSQSMAQATPSRERSLFSPRRIRWNSRAPTRCPRRNWTAS